MSVAGGLAAVVLKHVTGKSVDHVVTLIDDHLTDHSGALPTALAKAHDRAWYAVGLALAGDGWGEWLKDWVRGRDVTALRDAVRAFLDATPTGLADTPADLRVRACDELARLRRAGRLAAPGRDAVAADLRRYADPAGLAADAARAVAGVADALEPDAPHLARVLRLPAAGGTPLLAVAFAFFFRREVETRPELAAGLTFDALRGLSAAQDRGFALLAGRTEGVLDQLDVLFDALGDWFGAADAKLDDVRAKLDRLLADREVSGNPAHPLKVTVTNEKERELLRQWLGELRALPPALVDAADWGRLGDALAAGRLLAEARDAQAAAEARAKETADRRAEAEAAYKAFRVACEGEDWDAALPALVRAADLDPARFAPFPFARYEPVRVVGAGGFGAVVECRERLKKNRTVAVKALYTADLGRELDEVFGEAHTVSELADPGIIQVFHWDFADPGESRPYLVMEFFSGESLAAHLKRHGPLPAADLVAVAVQVAEAMLAAHGSNVLHRDLKPGNVLVARRADGTWDVRVIDFGLAVRFAAVQASVSTSLPHRTRRDQSFAGTLEYASPEQKGLVAAVVGPRADVYSFGKTFLEALLGTTEPVSDDWEAVPADLRDPLRRVLEKCVVRDPARRHDGFAPVVEALRGLGPAGKAARERAEAEARRQAEERDRAAREAAAREAGRQAAAEATREAAEAEVKRQAAEAERQQQAAAARERGQRMELWKATGMAREWLSSRLDGWTHDDWTALVDQLQRAPYWPLDTDEVGTYLEEVAALLRADRDRRREAERVAAEARRAEERRQAEAQRVAAERLRAEDRQRAEAAEEARRRALAPPANPTIGTRPSGAPYGTRSGGLARRSFLGCGVVGLGAAVTGGVILARRPTKPIDPKPIDPKPIDQPRLPENPQPGGKATLMLPGNVPMEFAWCPPGTFLMGSNHPEGFSDEKPVRRVTISKGYYTGVAPVTQAQWRAVTGQNPSHFEGPNRPVESVWWDDCRAFAERVATLTGKPVRLPTEAEWEYACRAGTTTEYHFGDRLTPDLANYAGNQTWNGSPKGKYRAQTTDVGTFPANPWGLVDVHGNVWEWCEDYYAPYPPGDAIDPGQLTKNSDNRRVLRGGSWASYPRNCRAANRSWNANAFRYRGCRLAFRLD